MRAETANQNAEVASNDARNREDQIESIKFEISNLKHNISDFGKKRNSDITDITKKTKQEINQLQFNMEEEIKSYRAHIEPIVESRNTIITLMEKVTRDIIPNEGNHHKQPFITRLNNILDLLNNNILELEKRSTEQSKILEQIESTKINISKNKPISLMIPYWFAQLEGKEGIEYVVLPLQKCKKPDKLKKGRKTVDILIPLFQSLESSKHNLCKKEIFEEAASYSIYPGKIASGISEAINELNKTGYLSKNTAKQMKKQFNLEGST